MPLYEYKCRECGNVFERLVIGRDELVECPKCRGGVEKLMSEFSVNIPDEVCGQLPRGEPRERCTECRQGGAECPL
ncbi:MAG: zinc ribbon domain-containing protein [Syntrophobacteraceae bacterium]